jgi:hypothetical protein
MIIKSAFLQPGNHGSALRKTVPNHFRVIELKGRESVSVDKSVVEFAG